MTGGEIRVAILNAGFSRRAFAREVGVPEQSIRRLENGEACSPAYAKRVADYFGVQVIDILPIGRDEPSEAAA